MCQHDHAHPVQLVPIGHKTAKYELCIIIFTYQYEFMGHSFKAHCLREAYPQTTPIYVYRRACFRIQGFIIVWAGSGGFGLPMLWAIRHTHTSHLSQPHTLTPVTLTPPQVATMGVHRHRTARLPRPPSLPPEPPVCCRTRTGRAEEAWPGAPTAWRQAVGNSCLWWTNWCGTTPGLSRDHRVTSS